MILLRDKLTNRLVWIAAPQSLQQDEDASAVSLTISHNPNFPYSFSSKRWDSIWFCSASPPVPRKLAQMEDIQGLQRARAQATPVVNPPIHLLFRGCTPL